MVLIIEFQLKVYLLMFDLIFVDEHDIKNICIMWVFSKKEFSFMAYHVIGLLLTTYLLKISMFLNICLCSLIFYVKIDFLFYNYIL